MRWMCTLTNFDWLFFVRCQKSEESYIYEDSTIETVTVWLVCVFVCEIIK